VTGRAVLAERFPDLVSLDADTGAVRWATPYATGESHSHPVIAGDLVYSVTKGSTRRLRIDAMEDGSLVTSLVLATGTGPPVDPVVANGVVYVVVDGSITAYAPEQSS
jgi:outer membrane protein assembly factor BamB